jgi:PAS domain S-box-containing protein
MSGARPIVTDDNMALDGVPSAVQHALAAAFRYATVGMAITDADGRLIDVNPAYCRMLGYDRGDLLGMDLANTAHPDDSAMAHAQADRLEASETDVSQRQQRYPLPDGSACWGLVTVTALRDEAGRLLGRLTQIQDITAWKETEEELRAREARFRALVQNDPGVIAVLDAEWRVVYMSPSAETAFGVAADAMLGSVEPRLKFIHPEENAAALGLIARVGAQPGATAATEARLWHEQQGWRWFQITVTNRLDDASIAGYVFNLHDITERKHAELATTTALETQQVAIAELEQLNRSKSRFLSTISHEFRTPLTAIIGYSELLATKAADPALVAEDAAVIHREASRLNRMVDDVLVIDQLDAHRIALTTQVVDLNSIARDVVETFRPLTGKHTLTLDLDPALRPVMGNPDRLSQALTNLISNAVKYSPAGGTVAIVTRNAGDDVLLSVHDEGIGIAARDASRIFDRFERVESGIAGRIPGTGLGLTIVRDVVSLHHGRLWVESKPRAGSTFFLALPARPSRREPATVDHLDGGGASPRECG